MIELVKLALAVPADWLGTGLAALAGLAAALAWSPAADAIASRLVARRPTLTAFRAIQRSWVHLAAGIVFAWIAGAALEELLLRGVVLQAVSRAASDRMLPPVAADGLGITVAAGAGLVLHLYQGWHGAIIVAQISVVFGLVFVLSGHSLWAVGLCHGLYDTVAFVRFAMGWSKYSKADPGGAPQA